MKCWRMELTEAKIRNELQPKGEKVQVSYTDTVQRGLVLTVNYRSLTWSVRYQDTDARKTRSFTLGRWPDMSLREARLKAGEVRANALKFVTARNEERAKLAYEASRTKRDLIGRMRIIHEGRRVIPEEGRLSIKYAAEQFLTRYVDAKKLTTADEYHRHFTTYVYEYKPWRDIPFYAIKRSEVTAFLDWVEENHTPKTADAVLATLSKMMNWWATRTDNYVPPIVKGMARAERVKRDRTLYDWEIKAVWHTCGEEMGFPQFVKFALLTMQRREILRTMKWADIDDAGVWKLPKRKEKRNKGVPPFLNLPEAAKHVLKVQELQRRANNPYVFPATRGSSAYSDFSGGKDKLDKAVTAATGRALANWTIHDLRRTSRTLMEREGIADVVAERVMGHTKGGIVANYAHHPYVEEMGVALDALAKLIERIVNPPDPETNVVPLHAREAA